MTEAPITAMVSYSWHDADAAELLHEELAMRGAWVFHDRCTFPTGSRIATSMGDAVERCDAFVAYFTPSSLYEGLPDGQRRPALDDEFLPVMRRWRTKASSSYPALPIIVPLTHGLGSPRDQAPQRVFAATGEDIASLWTQITLDQHTPAITQPEAAAVAAGVVESVLFARETPAVDAAELVVATRGEGQPPGYLTIDATRLLGGRTSRPGAPTDWSRLLAGLQDLQSALARRSPNRRLRIVARAHLTACLALGRVFNQAAGWQLDVAGRHGDASVPAATPDQTSVLEAHCDLIRGPGPLSVEIDLLGGNVTELATSCIRASGQLPCARLQLLRSGKGDLEPVQVGEAAAIAAAKVRQVVADLRPRGIQIFCAAPAEFAVLLGTRLTSLHADLQLHERDGESYVPSMLIPASVP